MIMPEVSVIIPNYNHAAFLKDRIDSVLNQTYQDIEVIILDDKSTDNSRDVINSYLNNPKVSHIVFNSENGKNTFKQWEKGIELAKGKYIWMAESDDKAMPDFLGSLLPAFHQNPKLSIAFCESYWINSNDNEVNRVEVDTTSYVTSGTDFIKKNMLTKNRIYNASMAVFKKDDFLRYVTPEYKDYKYCGDYLMWTQLLLHGDVFYLNKKLSYFRRHKVSVSHVSDKEGLLFTEGIKILSYINSQLVLSQSDLDRTVKRLIDKLTHQYIIRNAISRKNFLLVYNELKKYSRASIRYKYTFLLKKSILFPLYLLKNSFKPS
jgi:glycosyltransferase involved in cell wall biosynthesis